MAIISNANNSAGIPTALNANIRLPDGSLFSTYGQSPYEIFFSKSFPNWDRAYLPIPEDWEAGSYDVIWAKYGEGPVFDVVTAVAIPALTSGTTPPEEEIVIPSWIKSNAGWWDAGLIDNRNYVTGLQWLITNGIMTIPPTEQGTGSDDVIPSWVKNNARWWADGSIDDRNYVTGLQWLISNGVMTIG